MSDTPGTVLIIGAMSDIGQALAADYARSGHALVLAARDCQRLAPRAADLAIRYRVSVRPIECDVLMADPSSWFDALGELPQTVVCVAGLLGSQAQAQSDVEHARSVIATNFTGPAALLGEAAERMERRGSGVIVGVSSVAGDRGRASNYTYGSAKAGLTAFLSGLRNRLAKSGVRVITVKPGFVATRMTAGMKLPKPLTASSEEVAAAVLRAQLRGQDVVYVRPVWRLIMLIIGHIPESIFKKLSI